MTKKLQKDLTAVSREINALSKKIEKMIVAVDKLEKTKAAKKAKVKTVKKAPAKKKTVKAKPVVKKTAPQKNKKITAADTALKFIQRVKKGINTGTLVAKTGFDQKKIANIIYKLKKQGKIKSLGKGVYVKA